MAATTHTLLDRATVKQGDAATTDELLDLGEHDGLEIVLTSTAPVKATAKPYWGGNVRVRKTASWDEGDWRRGAAGISGTQEGRRPGTCAGGASLNTAHLVRVVSWFPNFLVSSSSACARGSGGLAFLVQAPGVGARRSPWVAPVSPEPGAVGLPDCRRGLQEA